MVAVVVAAGMMLAHASQNARADAIPGPMPVASAAPGLPDERVYEEVSPPNKNGHQAGASIDFNGVNGDAGPALAAPDGGAIFYRGGDQTPNAVSGIEARLIARRSSSDGWQVKPATPQPLELQTGQGGPWFIDTSRDLSHVLFIGQGSFASPDDPIGGTNIYLAGEDPFQRPVWLGRPKISNPSPVMGLVETTGIEAAGGSTDFGTVFFGYYGTLIPEDEPRAPYVLSTRKDPGFYEWTDASGLSAAGVLPNGTESPFGAVPAGELDIPELEGADLFGSQVSEDGSRAFFVSPNPSFPGLGSTCTASNAGSGGCVPELYLRERSSDGTRRTELVSRDDAIGDEGGSPAKAPHGVGSTIIPSGHVENAEGELKDSTNSRETAMYATPDGSDVFFGSVDALTSDAANDGMPKEYVFDTETNTLKYMAGVTDDVGGTAAVVASAPDGSRVMFARMTGSSAMELELWTDAANGGTVERITPLPAVPSGGAQTHVSAGRVSKDGAVFVFTSNSPLPGGFNNLDPGREGNVEEVYRYDTTSNSLECLSCPPAGVVPRSSAKISSTEVNLQFPQLVRNHGMSSDGKRVFFDTADPLVARDTNGMRDVYEWENGTVSLISSGSGTGDSLILDNGEKGDDVFFATTDGLSSADTDGEYDVYDARVPREGEGVAQAAEPCQGESCRPGPPGAPSLLGAPATLMPSGSGNLAAAVAAPAKGTTKRASKKVKRKKPKKARKKSRKVARKSADAKTKPGRR